MCNFIWSSLYFDASVVGKSCLNKYSEEVKDKWGCFQDTSWRIATPKSVPRLLRVDLNPRVSIPSFILIWGFIFWCMFHDEANSHMGEARAWVTDNFTWLYVGSQVRSFSFFPPPPPAIICELQLVNLLSASTDYCYKNWHAD